LADAHIIGHFRALMAACNGPEWGEFWRELGLPVLYFDDVGLRPNASDAEVWRLSQSRGLVLVTANRNEAEPDSLEATIRAHGSTTSLPVLTLANPERVLHDRGYAERVAGRLIESLIEIERLRGTGRLYLP